MLSEFINISRSTYNVSTAISETCAFSKHIAASQSRVGSVMEEGSQKEGRDSRAAMASQAPPVASAFCSDAPVHHTDNNLATHDLPTRVPSLATSTMNKEKL